MKFLIVGRSASGKDYLAENLEAFGLSAVKSYTTRPKRTPFDSSHMFVTEQQAKLIKDRAAETVINGYLYFATRPQIEENDIYIVDPKGFYDVTANMPDTAFMLIYVKADAEAAKEAAEERGDKGDVYRSRIESEDGQFSEFERRLAAKEHLADNCRIVQVINNDYRPETIRAAVSDIMTVRHQIGNLSRIVGTLGHSGCLISENGYILDYGRGSDAPERISEEVFTQQAFCSPDKLSEVIKKYLSLPAIDTDDLCMNTDVRYRIIRTETGLSENRIVTLKGLFTEDMLRQINDSLGEGRTFDPVKAGLEDYADPDDGYILDRLTPTVLPEDTDMDAAEFWRRLTHRPLKLVK